MTNVEPSDRTESAFEGRADLFGSPSRYDLVLTGIPVTFLFTYLIATQFFGTTGSAIATGALVSGVLVADGLFRRPPIP
ncbi:hypothetical protein [Haloferax sp. KTX1]|uniref:hypothetical protein n=1 Tax=Haloferax sp. KTX1 TaxID=2600597 RepID=UPI001651C0A8|nr:hypothetical protein [Haloferax sp. KTX1]